MGVGRRCKTRDDNKPLCCPCEAWDWGRGVYSESLALGFFSEA